jgi:hypothetical protein
MSFVAITNAAGHVAEVEESSLGIWQAQGWALLGQDDQRERNASTESSDQTAPPESKESGLTGTEEE